MNVSWDTSIDDIENREEVYNFKNAEDFANFVSETNNNPALNSCFDDENEDLNKACNHWLSLLNTIIRKCFRKIRLKKVMKDKELEKLFEKKEELKTFLSLNENSHSEYYDKQEELDNVIEDIAEKCAKKNSDLVKKYLGDKDDGLAGFNQAKTWALKKKLSPKNTEEPPAAKKDAKGNLITDRKLLENLYMDTYVERLKPNDIFPGLEKLEAMKEYLFNLRYEACKTKKTEGWTKDDLNIVFKSLKNNKARDSHGHVYEIFKSGGDDLQIQC